jgi:hypothetical protein
MVSQDSLLVTLVQLVDRLSMPPQRSKRRRVRSIVYSDRLFLKALVIILSMIRIEYIRIILKMAFTVATFIPNLTKTGEHTTW